MEDHDDLGGREFPVFDVDEFIRECTAVLLEGQPALAAGEVLERAVRSPDALARALPAERAEITALYRSPELSVFKMVWAPGMSIRPHNHLMWGAIGLYGGQEDNVFYRRAEQGGLDVSGGRELRSGDTVLMGQKTIHAVTNPLRAFTGAIHVYGGDLTTRSGRSEWDEQTFEERAYDFERTQRSFEEANHRLGA